MVEEKKILTGQKIDVYIKNTNVNSNRPYIIAGPCSVESEDQIMKIAKVVKESGADALRGGAFKPRTSPYSFQGLGEEGLRLLKKAGKKFDLPIVSEIMSIDQIPLFKECVDVFQVGSRNMHNYALLKALGQVDQPILLKRGLSATIYEWILAAEYIAEYGNTNIILCERGIRTFDTYTRNTLDIAAIPIMQKETGLPVIIDPSHGTGRRDLIEPMTYAGLAAGANGAMLEVHNDPDHALSDGKQSIDFDSFKNIMNKLRK